MAHVLYRGTAQATPGPILSGQPTMRHITKRSSANQPIFKGNSLVSFKSVCMGSSPTGQGWGLFLRSKGSRPAHFKELRTGDARPLRLSAREPAGTASPLAVPLACARGHRVPHSV